MDRPSAAVAGVVDGVEPVADGVVSVADGVEPVADGVVSAIAVD
jgi:hypothetical protein